MAPCHNGSVPRWLRATCWNGHREARATMVCSCTLIYVYAVWMGGAGGGVGDGLPMVSRVSLVGFVYAQYGWEGGWGWLPMVSRV